jgi:hypothetical protein
MYCQLRGCWQAPGPIRYLQVTSCEPRRQVTTPLRTTSPGDNAAEIHDVTKCNETSWICSAVRDSQLQFGDALLAVTASVGMRREVRRRTASLIKQGEGAGVEHSR